MSDINELTKSAKTMSGMALSSGNGNAPSAFAGNTSQYLSDSTRQSYFNVFGLASNKYQCVTVGLDYDDPTAEKKCMIRVAAKSKTATMGTIPSQDVVEVLFQDTSITYIPTGTILKFAGNEWIVPANNNYGHAIGVCEARRCNKTYRYLDWYGNILKAPFHATQYIVSSSTNQKTTIMLLADNSLNAIAPATELWMGVAENTRMILGKAAYSVRGLNDSTEEFSGDISSVRLVTFALERQEPTDNDDTTLGVAGYNSFSWVISITGASSMTVGNTQTLSILSKRNSETATSTSEYPISYIYASSNKSTATISSAGTIKAVAEGTATITVKLAQNDAVSATLSLTVEAASVTPTVQFTSTVPTTLAQYSTTLISASYFLGGTAQTDAVSFSFSGANSGSYSYAAEGTNAVRVSCWRADATPLTITASANGKTAQATINLISA